MLPLKTLLAYVVSEWEVCRCGVDGCNEAMVLPANAIFMFLEMRNSETAIAPCILQSGAVIRRKDRIIPA
jgi:hypothetical protein